MSTFELLLARNKAFAADNAGHPATMVPRVKVFVITCIDPRTDPAAFLGLEPGDAVVARSAGGRVTPGVIEDVAYIGYLAETLGFEGPLFEVAVIHHTDCGTAFLQDDNFRQGFVERSGTPDDVLAQRAVVDPVETVRADVKLLRQSPSVPPRVAVSGYVYDINSRLLAAVVD